MRNAMLLVFLGCALITIGCSGKPSVADSASAADDGSRACSEQGGDWRRVCKAQKYQCVKPHRDAGKACKDSSECEGECLVDLTTKCTDAGGCTDAEVPKPGEQVTGMCQRDDDPCGSFVVVREGRAQSIVHRD